MASISRTFHFSLHSCADNFNSSTITKWRYIQRRRQRPAVAVQSNYSQKFF